MEYALEERIGNPDLFVGRREELAYFLKWVSEIKERKSQSTAILARRKMGKTALMERLFNITFHRDNGVIPFYYEVKETKMWMGEFCVEFFLTFIYQYIAFKTRKIEYIAGTSINTLESTKGIARREGFDYLIGYIEKVEDALKNDSMGALWETVRQAPKNIGFSRKEFIVQMIDEFQFLNAMIYRDKEFKLQADTIAGGYLSTAESKVAPLLVSGSWVGWLMNELTMLLPARFNFNFLENMPESEALEMVFKYSWTFGVPVTEETAYLIALYSEGSPFYIGSIIRSYYKEKDLTTALGLSRTLEFETLNDQGTIKITWMEYVGSALPRINDQNAKNIVLYLCRHKNREITRRELLEKLQLDMTDNELEKRLKALVKADIIKQGKTNFDYQGVQDNIFDKVFRGVYEKEIREFDISVIGKEIRASFDELKKKYASLLGKHNYQKGYLTEYLVLDQLRLRAYKKNDYFKSITRYLPDDFTFCNYSRVWRYDASPEYTTAFSVDIFARSENPEDYSIIGEVKNRDSKKFSTDEVIAFEKKFRELKQIENVDRAVGFIFSLSGFTKEAEAYCQKNCISTSDDKGWLGI